MQATGAGAFGTVYKAKDKILGRVVAIKTIRLEGLAAAGASLDELMDRFKREAQVSAQLKHPNIVTIYDIGDADGHQLPRHGVHRRRGPRPRDRRPQGGCPSSARQRWARRWRTPWTSRTGTASSTATSSPPTS